MEAFPVASVETRRRFADTLFSEHKDFAPTRSLYVDFEGSGSGYERALGLFWPQKRGVDRFRLLRHGDPLLPLDRNGLEAALDSLNSDPAAVTYVVVFSGGKDEIDEHARFTSLFGDHQLASANWLNLHRVLRETPEMKRSIREHEYVGKIGKRTADYSLEALEWEFGIRRPAALRGSNHIYADGISGEMKILELEKRITAGEATDDEFGLLPAYCRQDVESLFKISRECEKLLQT